MATSSLIVPLCGGELDRADALRRDAATLDALLTGDAARLAPFWRGKPAVRLAEGAPPALALTRVGPAWRAADPDPVFLGLDRRVGAEAARFAVDLSTLEEDAALALAGEGVQFLELRAVSPELTPAEAGLACAARSLLEWRRAHAFCARCGQPTAQAMGGWRRDCSSCEAHHFPRTDPVVIMLVVGRDPATGAERLALGRQANWPPGMYSLLAGYVEPGEDVESAARREVFEESGLRIGRVRYLASQPWPFPSTLMIGVWAEALSETISPDYHELEDCRWFSRDELAQAFAGPDQTIPRSDAIARVLMRAWLEGTLPDLA